MHARTPSRFLVLRLGRHHHAHRAPFAPAHSAHRHQSGRCLSSSAIISSSAPPSPRTPSPFKAPDNDLEEADGHEQTQADFRHGLETVTSFYGRFIKYSALSLGTLLGLVYVGWEGAHQWVEWVELGRPSSPGDEDVFEWADESLDTKWTGGAAGGTDPRLGYRGRHAVRAAWMSLNWSLSDDVRITAVEASEGRNAYDKQLTDVLRDLSAALAIANAKSPNITVSGQPVVVDPTVADLLLQSAAVLERISSPSALQTAKPILQQVYDYHAAQGPSHDTAAARLSLKLGDVCSRLGESEEALAWWRGTLSRLGIDEDRLAQSTNAVAIARTVSPSPARQRLVASTLLSLSAHYASTRQFESALALERRSIPLILGFQMLSRFPSFAPSTPWAVAGQLDSNSAGGILHYLSLRYRLAILSIHQAEVIFAAKTVPLPATPVSTSRWRLSSWRNHAPASVATNPGAESLEASLGLLKIASEAAENICLKLTMLRPAPGPEALPKTAAELEERIATMMHETSTPPTTPDPSPPAASGTVDPAYAPLEKEARALLRQSKRAAAQALLLRGVLLEKRAARTGDSQGDAQALEQYERALAWAGGGPDGRAGNDAIESEWKAIWDNYVRVREKVLKEGAETWNGKDK